MKATFKKKYIYICIITQVINRKQHTYALIDVSVSLANRIIIYIARIHCSHCTRDLRQRTTAFETDTRERAGRELMLEWRRPENFTHRKAASINYETYTGYRGGGDKTKKQKNKIHRYTAKLNARGHRFCQALNLRGRLARFASRRAMCFLLLSSHPTPVGHSPYNFTCV